MISPKLLQAGIIIAAFCMMLQMLDGFLSAIMMLLNAGFGSDSIYGNYYLIAFFVYIVAFLVNLLVIRKSADIANWLTNAGELHGEFRLQVSYQNLLSTILITFGVAGFLQIIPDVLEWLVTAFTTKVGGLNAVLQSEQQKEIDWTYTFIRLLIYASLIYFSRPIAGYFVSVFTANKDIEVVDATDEFSRRD